jgi:hypothetical protein
VCSGFFLVVSLLWSVRVCGSVYGPDLILSHVVNFLIVNSRFPVTTLRLDLFSDAYLNKFTIAVVCSG